MASMNVVNKRVKDFARTKIGNDPDWMKEGREIDGNRLMSRVFSLDKAVIALADLSDDAGKNVQTGFQQIFAGAMTALRNPPAHGTELEQEYAKRCLFLASLLMYKLDEAGVP